MATEGIADIVSTPTDNQSFLAMFAGQQSMNNGVDFDRTCPAANRATGNWAVEGMSAHQSFSRVS